MTLPLDFATPAAPEPTKRRTTRKATKQETVRASDIDWSTVVRDVWLVAGTSVHDPYPCLCDPPGRCWTRCACRGRTDTAHLPQYCCATRDARRRTVGAGPVPLPPVPLPRVAKLCSPAPVDLVDIYAVALGLAV